jgi:hypothetical protein
MFLGGKSVKKLAASPSPLLGLTKQNILYRLKTGSSLTLSLLLRFPSPDSWFILRVFSIIYF